MATESERMSKIEVDASFDTRVIAMPKAWDYILVAIEPGHAALMRTNVSGVLLPGAMRALADSINDAIVLPNKESK